MGACCEREGEPLETDTKVEQGRDEKRADERRKRFEAFAGIKHGMTRKDYQLTALDQEMLLEFYYDCTEMFGSLLKAFRKFDLNRNGFLSASETETVGVTMNLPWVIKHHAHLFFLLDTNGDGVISVEEFSHAVKSLAFQKVG
eukprot:gnl/MRDRNA2_/MRDRNA2_226630_c0_seq1.p1 gnl/MRDRNA2_/MRDRNA2_226630_c0~~gnl/MRDRNA2_/MRDRNA2_226630_c0_seq1.p1  ORF type:complete len:143 (-),score=31.89 gnl/MRDRNA2_/MRDRNA2_226630_c0_seq1:57-485(-)